MYVSRDTSGQIRESLRMFNLSTRVAIYAAYEHILVPSRNREKNKLVYSRTSSSTTADFEEEARLETWTSSSRVR